MPVDDRDRRGGVEIHRDVDVGLLGLALDRRAALGERRAGWPARFPHLLPWRRTQQAAHAEVARELHVRLAIADHRAGAEVDVLLAHVALDQLDLRLAAVAAVALAMRADEHRVEFDALRAERIEHELVRHVERRLRKALAAEAVLVRDHGELEAGALRLAQRREHARHEADLLDASPPVRRAAPR